MWCVGGVFCLVCCVFLFLLFFVLVLVRAFLCPRRCKIYYEVPGSLYCGGSIGVLAFAALGDAVSQRCGRLLGVPAGAASADITDTGVAIVFPAVDDVASIYYCRCRCY